MFSQQSKRINYPNMQNLNNMQSINNPFPQYQNCYQNNVLQGLQQCSGGYSDFQMPYGFNDNFSINSSNSTATSMTSFKKKSFTEEINNSLTNCLEEFLPKVAEECAEAVYTKITLELESQAKEIEELKIQLDQLRTLLTNSNFSNLTHMNSTPIKKLKNLSDGIGKINNGLSRKCFTLKENIENTNYFNDSNYLDNIQEKLRLLKENVEQEKINTELLDEKVKDRHVDILGLKNLVDERVGYLLNDIQLNYLNSYKSDEEKKYSQILKSLDELLGKLSFRQNKQSFSNFETRIEKVNEFAISESKSSFNYSKFSIQQKENYGVRIPIIPTSALSSECSKHAQFNSKPQILYNHNIQLPFQNPTSQKNTFKVKKSNKLNVFDKFCF